ncbi:MAG: serine/threonine-protein phosphatase [Ruminococcus sp.]|nr:serine/threonine-protein phosphatase [Ruminococcus sp.]MBQ1897536.1 serine/threonine-protein phosphatase [Ruminococcus sp.]
MSFLATVHTDAGIGKENNQDSALQIEARTDFGDVMLSVVCDGMGGLDKGEVASATVIEAFSEWFEKELPKLIHLEDVERMIFGEWEELILDCNQKISAYADELRIKMGTTLNAILFLRGRYYIANVGDSRAYLLSDGLYQLTKDQTLVQREVDMGRLTAEKAAVSPRRNILLQCVGASPIVTPDYYSGSFAAGQVYMQCSDGFRHVVTGEEIYRYLNTQELTDERKMADNAVYLTELNKNRQEKDNITVLLVKVV